MEKIFDQYLYTQEDKLQDDATRIAFGEEAEGGITVVKNKTGRLWTMAEINAIKYTIAEFTKDKNLCSYMSGTYLGLQVILNADNVDMKYEEWKVLRSPELSCKKMAHLEVCKIVPILISLNVHRELWSESKNQDASRYFS